ncbi:hypothetical protein D3C75_1175960 [compost metagenome]
MSDRCGRLRDQLHSGWLAVLLRYKFCIGGLIGQNLHHYAGATSINGDDTVRGASFVHFDLSPQSGLCGGKAPGFSVTL